MTHGHFLLRLQEHVNYKPEGTTDKFEALVTTADDRVFGDMVVAQLNEEKRAKERKYRARKEKEHKERKAKEAKASGEVQANVALKDGQEDKIIALDAPGHPPDAADPKESTAVLIKAGAVLVTPVKAEIQDEVKDWAAARDVKHEAEAVMVPVSPAAGAADEEAAGPDRAADGRKPDKPAADEGIRRKAAEPVIKQDKERARAPRVHDPVKEAEALVRMLGPEAADIPLADLKAAFAAMEAASAAQKIEAEKAIDIADPSEPIIWMWSGPDGKCERWRWRNFAEGCGELEEGCWEERDWKVFGDGVGCEEFEDHEHWNELGDVDVHDWSC